MHRWLRCVLLTALVLVTTPDPVQGFDLDKRRNEAFAQWSNWIGSRDPERRSEAARMLGGYKDRPEAVGLLIPALADRDDGVRRQAAGSLWQLAQDGVDIGAAVPALRSRLDDPLAGVQVQAAGALEKAGVDPRELVDARRGVLERGSWFEVALAARDLIGWVDGADLVEPLLWSLREAPPVRDRERFDARSVLGPLVRRGGPGVIPGLMRALDDPSLPKADLLTALGSLQPTPPGWREALLRASRDIDPPTRAAAAEQLQALVKRGEAGANWIPALLPLIDDPYPEVRRAVCALFEATAGDAHPAIEGLLARAHADYDPLAQRAAIRAIAAIGDPAESYDRAVKADIARRAEPILEAVAADASAETDTRQVAGEALKTIREGSAIGTRLLAPSAPGSEAALVRLRERDVPFTEDAFWRALGERDVQTIEDLLDAGIAPASISADGMPPLHSLLMGGCDYGQPTADETRRIVATLLRHGADPNQRDEAGGNTALHRAMSCDAALVKQLVAGKADVNARNGMQMSAFSILISVNPDAAEALLDAGYRADARERAMFKAMLGAEKDPGKRRLLTRAMAGGLQVE